MISLSPMMLSPATTRSSPNPTPSPFASAYAPLDEPGIPPRSTPPIRSALQLRWRKPRFHGGPSPTTRRRDSAGKREMAEPAAAAAAGAHGNRRAATQRSEHDAPYPRPPLTRSQRGRSGAPAQLVGSFPSTLLASPPLTLPSPSTHPQYWILDDPGENGEDSGTKCPAALVPQNPTSPAPCHFGGRLGTLPAQAGERCPSCKPPTGHTERMAGRDRGTRGDYNLVFCIGVRRRSPLCSARI